MKPPETLYRGERVYTPGSNHPCGVLVTVNGQRLEPRRSQTVFNHSPTGFEWGYGGSGPAQLALALVLDATGDKQLARRTYQYFKWAIVCNWSRDAWEITAGDIQRWVEQAQREQKIKSDLDALLDKATDKQILDAMLEIERLRRETLSVTAPITAQLREVQEVDPPIVVGCVAVQRCSVCGCTEADCRQCITANGGEPCSWVAEDLCSRCANDRFEAAMKAALGGDE